jgi:hypothetical protein
LKNKEIAERELEIAKKLHHQIKDQKEDNSEFDRIVQNLENKKESQNAISLWEECEKKFQELSEEMKDNKDDNKHQTPLSELSTLLKNVNERFKTDIILIKKYNTKLTKKNVEEKQKLAEEWFSIINLSVGENKILENLKKEITDEIQNTQSKDSALSLFNKGKELFENYDIDNDNQVKNNKLDHAKFCFEESLKKYQQIKNKLKTFIEYILEQPKEKKEKLEYLQKNQQSLKKWQNILSMILIFHLIISIFYMFYIAFKTKKTK